MNPVVQFLANHRVAVLFAAFLCVLPWCCKAIWASALKTVHGFLDVILGPSSPPVRVRSKRSSSRAVVLNLHSMHRLPSMHRRAELAGRPTVLKCWEIRAVGRRRSVFVGQKCHSTRMNGKQFQHWYFVLSIICAAFSAVPLCPAQQNRAAQASLPTDMQTFQQVEDRWSKAINNRDQYALELVLSPELIDISATGDVTSRNQQIAMLFEKRSEPLSLDQRVLKVQNFGDLAVVIGTYVEQLRKNEKQDRRTGMFTHIYQNVRGNWLCVSAHRTPALEPAPQKARGAKKQHDAEYIVAGSGQSTTQGEIRGSKEDQP